MTAAAGSRIATSDDEIHSLTFEGPSCGGFSRPAAVRTGYVVLRIEPGGHGRPSRPWRASSAFPTLTGPVALAARLRGPGGPFWPLLGAIEGRRCLVGLVGFRADNLTTAQIDDGLVVQFKLPALDRLGKVCRTPAAMARCETVTT